MQITLHNFLFCINFVILLVNLDRENDAMGDENLEY